VLAANCHTLVTEWSTLAYVGLALGKPTYSYRDLEAHRAMLPVQHGRAAENIAGVCRDVMARRTVAVPGAPGATIATAATRPIPTLKGAA
jgi:hypothetical protein